MTIKGDLNVLLDNWANERGSSDEMIAEILDFFVCGDVLAFLSKSEIQLTEWIAGVAALHRKLL